MSETQDTSLVVRPEGRRFVVWAENNHYGTAATVQVFAACAAANQRAADLADVLQIPARLLHPLGGYISYAPSEQDQTDIPGGLLP